MKQTKEKQLRNVYYSNKIIKKRESSFWLGAVTGMVVLGIIYIIVIIGYENKIDELQEKLSECESGQGEWVLKVECQRNFLDGEITENNILTYTFNNFEEYQSYKELAEQNENCEVID